MLLDNDRPKCIFDDNYCEDCGFCNPSPFKIWIHDKELENNGNNENG